MCHTLFECSKKKIRLPTSEQIIDGNRGKKNVLIGSDLKAIMDSILPHHNSLISAGGVAVGFFCFM